MRIDDLLRAGSTRSFEFFPPKTDEEEAVLATSLTDIETLAPSFVSVTYRGGTESRQRTFDLVNRIQRDFSMTAMAHLICVGHSRADLRATLRSYGEHGVQNLMALGGDPPEDPSLGDGELRHAIELVELARDCGSFSVGVAAHPRGHPRSTSLVEDRRRLAEKLALADFAVTQFFFEAHQWTTLVAEMGALGVTKPVLPGIIPVTTIGGIERMAAMGGVVPPSLVARLEAARATGGSGAVRAEGIAAATEMCRELLERGAPGLHFYTMNRSTATREIFHRLFD